MTEHNITLSDLEELDLEDFDPAEYITSDEAAAAYITQALATNDAAIFAAAIGDIARARGMSDIAKAAVWGARVCTRHFARIASRAWRP